MRTATDTPSLCAGKINCSSKGWIGTAKGFLCADCYAHWVRFQDKKRKEMAEEAFQ